MTFLKIFARAVRRPPRGIRVLAIIPTAGIAKRMLKKCLRRLNRAARGMDVRTVVVLCPTNTRAEDAVRSVLAITDTLLCLHPPFSFARSNNAALALLQDEEYVLFLNDDCFFRKAGDLFRLIRTMKDERLACTGPWLEHWQYTAELPPETTSKGVIRISRPLIGACILWDRQWLKTTGYFDASFDGYGMEEADLCLRTLLRGGHWARDDRVVVDHIHHATVGGSIKSEESHLRNLRHWKEKYPGIHSWGEGEPWQDNILTSSFKEKTKAPPAKRSVCDAPAVSAPVP